MSEKKNNDLTNTKKKSYDYYKIFRNGCKIVQITASTALTLIGIGFIGSAAFSDNPNKFGDRLMRGTICVGAGAFCVGTQLTLNQDSEKAKKK